MADVALISVISSGAVGVLGGMSGFYGQRVTLHNARAQRMEARRDDLRAVLTEAADAAMRWTRPAEALDTAVRERAAVIDAVTTDMQRHLANLGVRLGTGSPAYSAYQRLQRAMFALEDSLRESPAELTIAALRNPTDLRRDLRARAQEVAALSAAVYASRDDYLDASFAQVGVAE